MNPSCMHALLALHLGICLLISHEFYPHAKYIKEYDSKLGYILSVKSKLEIIMQICYTVKCDKIHFISEKGHNLTNKKRQRTFRN